ncbi:hypothetical protein RI129_010337 [Pyrocoelia pectoralis]|uniref:Lipase domain-containing protein n=1 Tax=Pyrocoelia pectoralis TaxID=417401 RepID=A0AAN7V4B1_9COLE
MFMGVFLFGLLFKIGSAQILHRELDIPQDDAIGSLTKLGSTLLGHFLGPIQGDYNEICRIVTIGIAGSEIKVGFRPHSTCTYCCKLVSPHRRIGLYLHRRNNTVLKLDMVRKRGYLKANGVNSTITTVLYIHGFTEYATGVSARIVCDAYLSRKIDYNVLALDWSPLAVFPWYSAAANNTRVVSRVLAKFLKFYDATGELKLENVHALGFSLGSHIAAFASRKLKGRMGRITALDPAFPEFPLDNDPSQMLSKRDASYVDVIHTDGGGYGFPWSIGHSDFYPNGGRLIQPGCEPSQLAEEGNILSILLCGHFHAWRFYAESVRNPTAFPATKCGILKNGRLRSCAFTIHGYMGFAANKSVVGNFYLSTRNKYPYSKSTESQMFEKGTVRLIL